MSGNGPCAHCGAPYIKESLFGGNIYACDRPRDARREVMNFSEENAKLRTELNSAHETLYGLSGLLLNSSIELHAAALNAKDALK